MAAKFKQDMFVGAKFKNRLGQEVEIVEIRGYLDVSIKWMDSFGYVGRTTANQLRTGLFKNPFSPCVKGIGYYGVGQYSSTVNGKRTREYEAWTAMLTRCYCEEYLAEYPTYRKHQVCEEWHNFQNFAQWYGEKSQIVPENEVWHLDKDILNGEDYGPDVCVLIPPRLNMLLVKNDARRGETLLGVSYDGSRAGKPFRARCHNGTRKSQHLGWFSTEKEAYLAYKNFKEALVRELAEEYKYMIDERAYLALKHFQVKESD